MGKIDIFICIVFKYKGLVLLMYIFDYFLFFDLLCIYVFFISVLMNRIKFY